jgi:hypothetical protein
VRYEPQTSPNQSRRISPRRVLRDKLKRLYFAFYKLGVRLGVYILPAHEYVSEPNIIKLERTVDAWAKPSAMPGIYIDLDEQIANLRRVCARFQEEFFGNQHYQYAVKHAVNQSFRSGRSRTFGYVEAQVLHAAIRYYKPARLIDIGGGVPTYCASQAISMNCQDTGVKGRITCIEPYPVDLIKNLNNVELIERPVQQVPLEYFRQLGVNDIVFIDSNHVVRSGSEANYIVLDILPILSKGVLVQIHDMYFPYDYDRDVLRNFIHPNETALVGAFLACNTRYKTLFSLSMLHYNRRREMQRVLPEYNPESDWKGMRVGEYDSAKHFPSSLWLRVEG